MRRAACGADLKNKSSRSGRVQSVSSPLVDAQSPSSFVVESSLLPAQFPPLKPKLHRSVAANVRQQQVPVIFAGSVFTPPQYHTPASVRQQQFSASKCYYTPFLSHTLITTSPASVRRCYHTPWCITPFMGPATCALSPGLHKSTPPTEYHTR